MRAEGEAIGTKVNNREEWAPIVKDSTVVRRP
jgi:hypothetical protein